MRGAARALLRVFFTPTAAPWDLVVLIGTAFAFGAGRTTAGGAALLFWLAGNMILGPIADRAAKGPARILPLDERPRR